MNSRETVLSDNREEVMSHWSPSQESGMLTPAMDLFEDSETVVVVMDIPGANPADVEIELRDKILRVTATMEKPTVKGRYLLKEQPVATYQRSVFLVDYLNPEGAVAQVSDGALKIMIPKAKKVVAKRIEVVSL